MLIVLLEESETTVEIRFYKSDLILKHILLKLSCKSWLNNTFFCRIQDTDCLHWLSSLLGTKYRIEKQYFS